MQYLILDPILWLSIVLVFLIVNIFRIKSNHFSKLLLIPLVIIIAMSMPVFANFLVKIQEDSSTDDSSNYCLINSPSVTLIVLGGGVDTNDSQFFISKLHLETYRRTLSAYEIYLGNQDIIKKIILSGGHGGHKKEAEIMMTMLNYMGVNDQILLIENESLNTYQNAINVSNMLTSGPLNKIVLITSALHMRRAEYAFSSAGINVCKYPVDSVYIDSDSWIPQLGALYKTTSVIREMIAFWVYKIRY